MKKVLFATTALIATAGMAAADVKIGGYGRFGIDYNDANDRAVNGVPQTTITSRLRLQFDMSTETDGGVVLGARVRMQSESRDNNPGADTGLPGDDNGFNGARFYASYGGFSVGVGNIIGAIENTPGLYLETRTVGTGIDGASFVSLVTNANITGGEYFNWDAYSSSGMGVNGVEVLYSSGAFNGHISYSTRNGAVAVDRVAANVSYSFGDWTAAVGVQDSDMMWQDKVLVTLQGDLGQYGVRLAYADNDGIDKWGLYGNMDIGAASNILLWVTDEDAVSNADVLAGRGDNRDVGALDRGEGTSYGIHYSYDLGGGASFEAGAREASHDNTTVQAGVYFSF